MWKKSLRSFLFLLLCQPLFSAGLYNLKILNDNVPDYTDLPSLARSLKGTWSSDEEIMTAVWWWVCHGRVQMPNAFYGSTYSTATRIYDPIVAFNDYGYHNCGPTASILMSIAHQLGYSTSSYGFPGHTLPDVMFGGKPHLFDAAFGFVFYNKSTREIAGLQELNTAFLNGGGEVATNPVLNPVTAPYYSPYTSYPVPYYTAADAYSPYEETGRYIFSEYKEWNYASYNTNFYSTGWVGHVYRLHLKPAEEYTRYWEELGTTPDFYLANSDGEDPNHSSYGNRRVRGNGRWSLRPDFASTSYRENVETEINTEWNAASPHVRPASLGATASVIFRVDAANLITSADLSAVLVRKGNTDPLGIYCSSDSGATWQPVWTASTTGTLRPAVHLRTQVAKTYGFLLKVEMSATAAKNDIGIDSLTITTLTQHNQRCLPFLRVGANRCLFDLGAQQAGAAFAPVEITYDWVEHRSTGDLERSHVEVVSDSGHHEYFINVMGVKPPTMKWLRLRYRGQNSAPSAGYSDGTDVGFGDEQPRYYFTYGLDLAFQKSYSYSVNPDQPSANQAASTKFLTNGRTPPLTPSAAPVFSSGWSAGKNPVITLDLGAAQSCEGVRILQPVARGVSRFADSIQVYTSPDSQTFVLEGAAYGSDIWNSPTNDLWPNLYDSPVYDADPYGGIFVHQFPAIFRSGSVQARYIRLKVYNPTWPAYLSEIQVLDKMTRKLVKEEFNHGFTLPAPNAVENRGALKHPDVRKGVLYCESSPNPFLQSTRIAYLLNPGTGRHRIAVYNLEGRVVREFRPLSSDGWVTWDGRDFLGRPLSRGTYFIGLAQGKQKFFKRIVKL